LLPSYFSAISLRCQAKSVGGVTIAVSSHAACANAAPGPYGQASALIVVEAQPLTTELFAENEVLLLKIVDDILLLLV
jgi:hypothetical protein